MSGTPGTVVAGNGNVGKRIESADDADMAGIAITLTDAFCNDKVADAEALKGKLDKHAKIRIRDESYTESEDDSNYFAEESFQLQTHNNSCTFESGSKCNHSTPFQFFNHCESFLTCSG